MKNETIIWFKNGATAKKSEIHFDDNGQICFNDAARQVLPKHVNLGLAAAKNCLELYVCIGIKESTIMRHAGKIFRKCGVKEPLFIRPVCKGTFSLPYKKFSPAWFYEVPRSRFFCKQGKNTQEY